MFNLLRLSFVHIYRHLHITALCVCLYEEENERKESYRSFQSKKSRSTLLKVELWQSEVRIPNEFKFAVDTAGLWRGWRGRADKRTFLVNNLCTYTIHVTEQFLQIFAAEFGKSPRFISSLQKNKSEGHCLEGKGEYLRCDCCFGYSMTIDRNANTPFWKFSIQTLLISITFACGNVYCPERFDHQQNSDVHNFLAVFNIRRMQICVPKPIVGMNTHVLFYTSRLDKQSHECTRD